MKKGFIGFMPILMATVLIMLVLIYMTLIEKHGGFSAKMGEIQGAVIATQARAEKAMFFIDRSAQYAETTAGDRLAQSGGFYEEPACGNYFGITQWNAKGRECWPENAAEAYEKHFTDELMTRLAAYPDTSLLDIKYSVFYHNGNLYGYALDDIRLPILFVQPEIRYDNLVERKVEEIKTANPPMRIDKPTAFIWPGNSTVVTSCFGWRNIDYGSTEHRGIDIRAAVGDPVYAMADGKARLSSDVYNTVTIEHKDAISSVYIHNSQVLVKAGQEVKQGDVIALAGKAGAKFPHIHLTMKKNNAYIDPLDPDSGMIGSMKFGITQASNCYYACSQYSYCPTLKERVTS